MRMTLLLIGMIIGLSSVISAEEPVSLHLRIDQILSAKEDQVDEALTSDAAFCRRVYLDLAGRIPETAELNRFFSETADNKRELLIDQLLGSRDYSVRLRDFLHVMLMERLGDHEEWTAFLDHSAKANKPWDQIVQEILAPNADEETIRGAAFFWTKRLENYGQNPVDYPALTRDVGRLFLGVDLQCAQCHDHLFIDEYKQSDFQGMAAFTWHTFIRKDVKFPAVGEKVLEAPLEFASVFTGEQMKIGPRLPGRQEVSIPMFEKGEEFEVPPDRKTRFSGLPRFRPLEILAKQTTAVDNLAFARNSANRFWFLMFGRGLVHPLDLTHSDNPPSHPELYELLAQEFARNNYDIRWFLKELAMSSAYQRSSRSSGSGNVSTLADYSRAWERPLSAEQMLPSMLIATGQNELGMVPFSENVSEELEQNYQKHLERFKKTYANIPRDPEVDYRPSVKASLFLMNDPETIEWFDPETNSHLKELVRLNDEELCQQIYRQTLSRLPSDVERVKVLNLLASSKLPRERLVGHLLWSLVASAEFALNH